MSIELNGTTGIDFNDGSNQSTSATPYGRKNLIINGDMRIAQRGTSTSGQTSGGYTVDRFRTSFSGRYQAVWTDSQTTDVPSGQGFSNSFKVEMTTAETSMDTGTSEYFTVEHRMEGQHLQHLSYGTASAKKVTLSFWVKSSVTGTLAVSLYNVDSTRIIGSTYTINTANTWEKKTITFDGDTVGTLDNDNEQSFGLRWFLGAADGLTSTDNTTWQSYVTTNFAYGHGTNAIPETSGATWQITGVQLEVGDAASDFEFVPYDMELARCQRYYQRMGNCVGQANGTASLLMSNSVCASMRTTPTAALLVSSWVSGAFSAFVGGSWVGNASPSISGVNLHGTNLTFSFNGFSGLTNGTVASLNFISPFLELSSEL